MDISDLEWEKMRRRDDDLEYHIRSLRARIDEVVDMLNELRYTVNTIQNGDDIE